MAQSIKGHDGQEFPKDLLQWVQDFKPRRQTN